MSFQMQRCSTARLCFILAILSLLPYVVACRKPTPVKVPFIAVHPATSLIDIPRGGGWLPGGWNPFGYKITPLGEQYLSFDGSLDSDVGRFLASLKVRKTVATLKAQWIEIVKVSKQGQSMRIYRILQDLLKFCLEAGFID
jgi:hypothetical protein